MKQPEISVFVGGFEMDANYLGDSYRFVNETFMAYHEHEHDAIEGYNFEDVHSALTVERIRTHDNRTLDGEQFTFQSRLTPPSRSDGSPTSPTIRSGTGPVASKA